MSAFWGPKWVNKKLGFRPRDPHGEIRAGILRILPPEMSKTVGWRPIWWQKGVIWGPLGFRARPAHPAGGGGRAVAPTLTPLVSTHPPKNCYPPAGGNQCNLPSWAFPAVDNLHLQLIKGGS